MKDEPINLHSPSYRPDRLLVEAMFVLRATDRSALARLLEVDPALVCRVYHKKSPLSELLMVRIMERTDWGIRYVRELAGMPYDGPVALPRPTVLTTLPRARNEPQAKANILQAMPGTLEELAKRSGYSLCWVKKMVRQMRAGDPLTRACHIIEWLPPRGENGGGPYIAVHAAGPGEDFIPILKHRKDRPRQVVHSKLRLCSTAQRTTA